MKSVLIVAVLFLAQQVYSAPPPYIAKCMQDHGVTLDDAKLFNEKGEASDKMKCSMKCVMMASGAMSDDGKLLEPAWLTKMPADIQDTLKACMTSVVDSDPCVTAFNNNKCLREKNPEFYKKLREVITA